MTSRSNSRWRLVAAIWLAVVGWSTLRSAPSQAAIVAALPWYCIACGQSGVADLLLNLLLFLPLGFAARALVWPVRRTLAVLFVLTVAIEVTQGALLVGRDAALGDVLANTLGGMIGWFTFPLLSGITAPPPGRARRGAALVLVLTIAVWFATAVALHPALGDSGAWVGQLTHRWPYHDPFPGRVLEARVNGSSIPEGLMSPAPARGDSLDLIVDVNRVTPAIPSQPASLLRVIDLKQRIQVDVTERYDDVILEAALRGSAWRLHAPAWRFRTALQLPIDRAWRLEWRWRRDRLELLRAPVDSSAGATEATIPFSVALGWLFIHPFVRVVGETESLWTVLWLGWWFGLLGWLAGWCRGADRWLFGGLAIAGFVGAGMATGLHPSPVQLASALVSYLAWLGAAVQWRRARRPSGNRASPPTASFS